MANKKLKTWLLTIGFSIYALSGCSSVKKADIPATADPREEISKLDADLNEAVGKNIDVLAPNEFVESEKYLEDAKIAVTKKGGQIDAIDDLRTGRGYLQKAYEVAQGRESKAEGLFEARQMALKAGAGRQPQLAKDLAELDREVSLKASRLGKTSADKLAEFQNRYVDLERRAVILSQLAKVEAIVNGGGKYEAKEKAPMTYKKAELSLHTAESVISTSVRNPEGYKSAVETAQRDAAQLLNVLAAIRQNGRNIPESVAIKLVAQNKKISGLASDLEAITAVTEVTQSTIEAKNKELAAAERKIQFQNALEKAREKFSPDEAEAYQQGDVLVIRLKKVNFASGRADLPAKSLPLLEKVSEVAKELNPAQILVEGHTDSIGTAEKNKTISEKRAQAVATFLKANGFDASKIDSEGLGFERPIANNKSKEGRAQNRRVDIIITPEATIHSVQ